MRHSTSFREFRNRRELTESSHKRSGALHLVFHRHAGSKSDNGASARCHVGSKGKGLHKSVCNRSARRLHRLADMKVVGSIQQVPPCSSYFVLTCSYSHVSQCQCQSCHAMKSLRKRFGIQDLLRIEGSELEAVIQDVDRAASFLESSATRLGYSMGFVGHLAHSLHQGMRSNVNCYQLYLISHRCIMMYNVNVFKYEFLIFDTCSEFLTHERPISCPQRRHLQTVKVALTRFEPRAQVLAERPDVEMSNCNQDPALLLQDYYHYQHSTPLRQNQNSTLYISVLEKHAYSTLHTIVMHSKKLEECSEAH